MKNWILFFVLLFQNWAIAQHILPIKYYGCSSTSFSLESDSIVANIDLNDFKEVILSGIDTKFRSNLRGTISMQIIVDLKGNSCLLSIENKTNIETKNLNLKNTVDSKLKWVKPIKTVSTLVVMLFGENRISIKRLGFNIDSGWQEISYKENTTNKTPIIKRSTITQNNPKIFEDYKTNSIWMLYNTENSIIPSNVVRSIDIDSKGIVWASTEEGIVKIENNKWSVIDAKNSPLPEIKNGKTFVFDLKVDKKDRIWISSLGGTFMFDGANWKKFDKTNSPLRGFETITVDRTGAIWFGSGIGLIKYNGNEWNEYNTKNCKIPSNSIKDVYLDHNNILWVSTNQGLTCFKNGIWTVYNTENSKLPNNNIYGIGGDSQGNLWFGSGGVGSKGGLVKIDSLNNWTVYSKENSKLPSNTIWGLEIDNNSGLIWLGVYSAGLVCFDGTNWEMYNSSNSIVPDFVHSIAIDPNGAKWIGTSGGLIYTTKR